MLLPIVTASAGLPLKQLPEAHPTRTRTFVRMAALMLLAALVVLCGCGGGSRVGKKTGKGAAVFTITWPRVQKSTRLIPAAANLIRIKITQTNTNTNVTTIYGSQDASRPTNDPPTTTLTFNNLPPGQFSATATAYPSNPDVTPPPPTPIVAQAMATVPLTIADGQTTNSSLTMNTTIKQVVPLAFRASVQTTRGFTSFVFKPQAKDQDTDDPMVNIVMLGVPLQVTVSDNTVARVSPLPGGQFAISNAGKLGPVTVTVTETESKFAQSFSLLFLAAYIYVADSNNNRLVRVDDIENPSTGSANFHAYGPFSSTGTHFDYPQQLTVDSLNRVYVADTGNNRIVRVDDITNPATDAANFHTYGGNLPADPLSNPYGVAMDALGQFYIADSGNARIVFIRDFNGNGFTTFGTYNNSATDFGGPIQVALDSRNYLYVTDPFKNRIVQIKDITQPLDAAGNFISYFGNGSDTLNGSYGIAVDSQHRIYIADTNNNRIVRINDINGAGFTTYDASNSGTRPFYFPISIALDPQNRIYIADSNNNRIVRIDDMTGTGFVEYGAGQLSFPYGIAVR